MVGSRNTPYLRQLVWFWIYAVGVTSKQGNWWPYNDPQLAETYVLNTGLSCCCIWNRNTGLSQIKSNFDADDCSTGNDGCSSINILQSILIMQLLFFLFFVYLFVWVFFLFICLLSGRLVTKPPINTLRGWGRS